MLCMLSPIPPAGLRDLGAVLQRVVDAVDVVLHHDEEAGKLRLRRTGVEEVGVAWVNQRSLIRL